MIAAAAVITAVGDSIDIPESFYDRVNKVRKSFEVENVKFSFLLWAELQKLKVLGCVFGTGKGAELPPANGGVPGGRASQNWGNRGDAASGA